MEFYSAKIWRERFLKVILLFWQRVKFLLLTTRSNLPTVKCHELNLTFQLFCWINLTFAINVLYAKALSNQKWKDILLNFIVPYQEDFIEICRKVNIFLGITMWILCKFLEVVCILKKEVFRFMLTTNLSFSFTNTQNTTLTQFIQCF